MPRELIDFNQVPEHQRVIDARLANWGRWCNGSWGAPSSSPMFRLTPPSARSRADYLDVGPQVDSSDASRIASAVTALPELHRRALHWCYVKPCAPMKACRALGQSMAGLRDVLNDARQMLVNRGE